MQFRHASAHYISKKWELLSILMITYDFFSTMAKELWAVFMIYCLVAGSGDRAQQLSSVFVRVNLCRDFLS